jgi:hypothetical protein
MMGKGKLYNIKVTARTGPGGNVIFTPRTSLPHVVNGNTDIFTFNKTNNDMFVDDFYLVQFTLDDRTNPAQNLSFPANHLEAFFSRLADDEDDALENCLEDQEQNNDFRSLAVLNDNCLLTINMDSAPARFIVFTLKFLIDGGPGFVLWDPIDNGLDGGKPRL